MDLFPIRVLAEKTGVAPTTLRAWERRYGLLKPRRTPKGHRLYDMQDVETVSRIVALLNQDYTVSKAINAIRFGDTAISTGLNTAVNATMGEDGTALSRDSDSQQVDHWQAFRQRLLTAIEAFDENRLDAVYNEALSLYPIDLVSAQLLHPLLRLLGERWQQRDAGIAEEHFFTTYLRNKVGARMHHAAGRKQGSRILQACVPGEFHELGSLLFALSAMTRGYRMLSLGTDLPLDQVRQVAAITPVDGVLLSAVTVSLRGQLARDLENLAEHLSVPLMLGGMASTSAAGLDEKRITLLGDDYRAALQVLEQCVPAYR